MDVNSLAAEFGSAGVSPETNSGVDVHALVSEFGSKEKAKEVQSRPKVYISTAPHPPVSGFDKQTSDELNSRTPVQGGENPRPLLPSTNIQESAYNADKSAQNLIDTGVSDFESGHPYKALGKVALGSAAKVMSPVTGIVEGAVSNPVTQITGNPDIGDRAGFVASSFLPVAPAAKAVSKAIPSNKAFETLVKDIGEENLPAVVSELKANPRLAPADLSPKVLQKAQNLFTLDGPQINYLKGTSDARMAGAKGAVETAYDTATGLPVNAVEKLKELKKTANDVGSNLINPSVAGAKPVNVTPVIEHIDNILKPGVNSKISNETMLANPEIKKGLAVVKQYLTDGINVRTSPQELHEIQSMLRRSADAMLNSADGGARQTGHALMQVRNKLVEAIDEASPRAAATSDEMLKAHGFSAKQIAELPEGPLRDKTLEVLNKAHGTPISDRGTYKGALSGYRDAKHIDDAFHQGYDSIFTNSKKLEGRPEFTEEWFKGLTPAEKDAAREGARLQLDTTIHNTRFAARRGQEVPEADFNRKKLEIIFGKEKTDELITTLRHERAIANTHNKVIEGSQTAMRSAAKADNALPIKKELGQGALLATVAEGLNITAGGVPLVPTALLAAGKIASHVKHKYADLPLAMAKNARYAEYALPTEGPSRDALIKALEARIPGPKPSLLNKVKLALPVANP